MRHNPKTNTTSRKRLGLSASLLCLAVGCKPSPEPLDARATCQFALTRCGADQAACVPEQIEPHCSSLTVTGSTRIDPERVPVADLLFMIENTSLSLPIQRRLVDQSPRLFERLRSRPLNYHVGVVSSDVGSTLYPGHVWDRLGWACNTFAGDGGTLQSAACDTRNVTPDARMACAHLCPDSTMVPSDGRPFIAVENGVTNVPPKLERDGTTGKMVDSGPMKAFRCMALIGDVGCGITGHMEAVRRALLPTNTANAGFLRPDSILAVVMVTSGDDCSVPLPNRNLNSPNTINCLEPSSEASPLCFTPSETRCLAGAITCDEPMNTSGIKTNCKARANSYLEPTDTYFRFLSSLRPKHKLALAGIWPRPALDEGGRLEIESTIPGDSRGLNLAGSTRASCAYAGDTSVWGNAQIRLSTLARSFGNSKLASRFLEHSACELDSFDSVLTSVVDSIFLKTHPCVENQRLGAGSEQPLCLVRDEPREGSKGERSDYYPACSEHCCQAFSLAKDPQATDPQIRASCKEDPTCYCAVESSVGICDGASLASVWRPRTAPQPAGTVTRFDCLSSVPPTTDR